MNEQPTPIFIEAFTLLESLSITIKKCKKNLNKCPKDEYIHTGEQIQMHKQSERKYWNSARSPRSETSIFEERKLLQMNVLHVMEKMAGY
jgi:hypothetical protein